MLLSTTTPPPALDLGPRPDPALGIYETMLVRNGSLPHLRLHLERMRASAHELYGVVLDEEDLSADLTEHARAHRDALGRLRVTVTRAGAVTIESGPIPPAPPPTLAPYVLPGGLGPHKWADRRLLEALANAAQGALPLLIDVDGSVLETARTSVLIEERGRLIAPPADGRALPGIGRRALDYTYEPVDLGRLLAADAVILTSALRVTRLPQASA